MTLEIWLLFVLTCFITAATPGPGNLLVVSYSVHQEKGKAFLVILGILTGLLALSALAIAGVSAVLTASENLFRWVQLAGAGYILYLGIKLIRTPSTLDQSDLKMDNRGPLRFFLEGVVVAVANPKSIAFFAALFPPFINPEGDVGLQYIILISTQTVLTFLVLSLYSHSTRKLSPVLRTYGGAFNKVTGGLFVGLALFFVQSGRS